MAARLTDEHVTRLRSPRPREHALQVLEFFRVLDLLAGYACSAPGARRIGELRPTADARRAEEALALAEEMMGRLGREPAWSPGPIPDLAPGLERLFVPQSVLSAEALIEIGTLLATSRRVRDAVGEDEEAPRSAEIVRPLVAAPAVEKRIGQTFDEAGEVADHASPELKRIRRSLRDRRGDLVNRLERFARELPERVRVADASITVRNGRYCIPIRREGRRSVGGIVHDASATRQTIFVEPPVAIEEMNEIRELEMAESREVKRILSELTDALRPLAGELATALEILARLDAVYAIARYALVHGGVPPRLEDAASGRGEVRITSGRHPLLMRAGDETVPFDLLLARDETVVLISGPNAGGKTVLLKSIGLLSAMAQSGIVPPVGPGTVLPVYGDFFAVIGDEQSIDASLSTFSAQMANVGEIVSAADSRSLIVLDEIGSATDPAEGAALAGALLIRLAGQAALTVASTHLGSLKALASETPRVVNASLQFDADALQPTFLLARDRPGRSYALEIAARLGLPEDLLDEARQRITTDEGRLEELLADFEARHAELGRLVSEAEKREARSRDELEKAEARVREVERHERELARSGQREAERYLLEARGEVERAIDTLREEVAGEMRRSPVGDADVAAAERRARGEVERAVRELRDRTPEPADEPARAPDLRPGDAVRVRGTRQSGIVAEVREDRVTLETAGMRLTVPPGDLERADPRWSEEDRAIRLAANQGDRLEHRPRFDPRMEVDLRGLRVEEVEAELVPAVDAAIWADLPLLRIIHGKGTGALRARVRTLLDADARVSAFRPGAYDEGGAGVTVIEFRESDS